MSLSVQCCDEEDEGEQQEQLPVEGRQDPEVGLSIDPPPITPEPAFIPPGELVGFMQTTELRGMMRLANQRVYTLIPLQIQ